MYKKLMAFLMAVIMAFSVVSVPVFSAEAEHGQRDLSYSQYTFSTDVDTVRLVEFLEDELMSCPKRVNLFEFMIPYTTEDATVFQKLVWHGSPVLFHVYGMGFSGRDGYLEYVYFTYLYEEEEYKSMYNACVNAAAELLRGIKGNSSLSDVTKALLLHDRLIESCEYDYEAAQTGNISNESAEMYGALVNGIATCQGYSYAYMYLLREVGIESYICSSKKLFHDWNIVIINGVKYHVDVTSDDPLFDITGRVNHDFFLLSTEAIKKDKDHNANDFDSSPNDTKYDSYYWRGCDTGFQLAGNNVYYINNSSGTLNRVGVNKSLKKVDDVWPAPGNRLWAGNYTRLSTDGENLFYNLSDSVYIYDTTTGESHVVYEPTLNAKDSFSIFGFAYDEGYLVCDLYNNPKFEIDTKSKYQIRVPYDLMPPTLNVTYSSELSGYQTVTLDMYDDMKISGYYIGSDTDYHNNTYVPVDDDTVDLYISESGRYYFTARDGAGNVSDTISLSFGCIELESMGGTLAVPRLILPYGARLTLPVPKRNGHEFVGWFDGADEAAVTDSVIVTGDLVYFALWKKSDNPSDEPADPDLPPYVNRFTDVPDSAWYADEVAYCVQRQYMNGISATLFSPNSSLTREQFVLILANASGVDSTGYKYTNSGMKDVPTGQWYSGAIAWAVDQGYISGVSEGVFGLRQNITREQLARLFHIYAQKQGVMPDVRADLKGFSDYKKVGSWAYENVQWAVGVGLISGMNGGMLAPRASATRAQAARMFMMFDALK